MNHLENWFCGSWIWHWVSRRHLLPGLLRGRELGEHVLELGAGPGAGTEYLRRRAPRLTSLESDGWFIGGLRSRYARTNVSVVQGDAVALPFAAATFSAAIATFMLHHLRSSEHQDKALAEIARVLRPGGVFLALEIPDSRWMRMVHYRDTYVPLKPAALPLRLTAAGFSRVAVDLSRAIYRLRAVRADGRVDRRESPA